MSLNAPWLALAIDWQDSEMFDDAPHGERLAWVCLLCFAKAQGRAGRVRLRDKAFAQQYRLTTEAVSGMIARAVKSGAVTVKGDVVTVVNWRSYQDPRARSSSSHDQETGPAAPPDSRHFTETAENDATKETSPSTKHQAPITKDKRASARCAPFVPPTLDEVRAYCAERCNRVDPEAFLAHYTANGWVQGNRGKPVRDWKACVITWEKNSFSGTGHGNHPKPTGARHTGTPLGRA